MLLGLILIVMLAGGLELRRVWLNHKWEMEHDEINDPYGSYRVDSRKNIDHH